MRGSAVTAQCTGPARFAAGLGFAVATITTETRAAARHNVAKWVVRSSGRRSTIEA